MKHIDSKSPTRFEDASLPNSSYSFVDSGNNEVVVSEPVPEKHTPHDGVAQDPAVFQNVGYAVRNYDQKETKHIDESGCTVKYVCDDFYTKIEHPCRFTKKDFSLVVGIRYEAGGKNYTKTFYDEPGGIF